MTPEEGLAFVREKGVVLASAKGPAPRMAEVVAGEPIRGSWWAHPKGREIYQVLRYLADSPEILSCRLVAGKATFVHQRLWPALIRMSERFPADRLAKTVDEHTPSGRHQRRDIPFPLWVDPESLAKAEALSEADALAALVECHLLDPASLAI